jgi:hypothetical protein
MPPIGSRRAAAAAAFINLLPDDEAKDVSVSVSGWVQWTGTYPDSHVLCGASCSVSASLVKREAAAA